MIQVDFLQPLQNYMNNPSFYPGFEGHSARQVLAQMSLNLMKGQGSNHSMVGPYQVGG